MGSQWAERDMHRCDPRPRFAAARRIGVWLAAVWALAAGVVAGYAAPASSTALVLEPPTAVVAPGALFTTTVWVHTVQSVSGAAAYLNFDPARLQVEAVLPGSALNLTLANQVDNTSGRVDYAAGRLSGFPTADFVLVTVVLRAGPTLGETPLDWSQTSPRKSDVIDDRGASLVPELWGSRIAVATLPAPTHTPIPTSIPPAHRLLLPKVVACRACPRPGR